MLTQSLGKKICQALAGVNSTLPMPQWVTIHQVLIFTIWEN
jgi:hypothetical protein